MTTASESSESAPDTSGQEDPSASSAGERGRGAVFWITVVITAAFVAAGVLATEDFNAGLEAVVGVIIDELGWLFLLLTTFFLGFVVWLGLGRYGKVTLGAPGEKPEFGLPSWFAMLFQAGMGIGLVFWGISEPILHYNDPPFGMEEAGTPEAAALAIQYAFFHWGFHPWAIYAVVGVAIAYFSYRRGTESLQVSDVLRPLLGSRVDGPLGSAINVLAILATIFGIAVSLGLGTLQIEAGLSDRFGFTSGVGLQLGIIGVTGAAFTISALTPIARGIRYLSWTSMILAVMLVGYFAAVGPTVLQLGVFTQGLGDYASGLVPMSLRLQPFDRDPWLGDWTLFFWATWIAWAPYVGVFIARISRGRTIRQFVVGVLAAPAIFSMIWFSVLGGAALDTERETDGAIGEVAQDDEAMGAFTFVEQFPLAALAAGVVILLVWVFFVTGADSGTVVLGSLSSRGKLDPPRSTKLVWGAIMASVAATLLIVDELDALQNGAIAAAGPFGVLMLLICASLVRCLGADERARRREAHAHQEGDP